MNTDQEKINAFNDALILTYGVKTLKHIESESCWCYPDIEIIEDQIIFIHKDLEENGDIKGV